MMSSDILKHDNNFCHATNLSCRAAYFHVALETTLYCDYKISKCYNRCISSLTASEVLRHAAPFLLHLLGIL